MATENSKRARRVRVVRFGLSCAAVSAVVFACLWMFALLPMGPSDLMVVLFMPDGQASMSGLLEGILASSVIGLFGGLVAEAIYWGLCWLERRQRESRA